MDLKQSLKQLCDIQKEIKELQSKIEKLKKEPKEKLGSIEASSQIMPFQKYVSAVFGYNSKVAGNIRKYNKMLDKRVVSLIEQLVEVEKFIEDIQDSRIRLIIEHRYINQYSWDKTASMIDNYATADNIRKELDRFLNKV